MKCIKTRKPVEILRVTEMKAFDEVTSGRAIYVPKRVWKTKVRDVGRETARKVY